MPKKRIETPLPDINPIILTQSTDPTPEGLKMRLCRVCGKEKYILIDYVKGRSICKACENAKKKKKKIFSDPKMKWRSYG